MKVCKNSWAIVNSLQKGERESFSFLNNLRNGVISFTDSDMTFCHWPELINSWICIVTVINKTRWSDFSFIFWYPLFALALLLDNRSPSNIAFILHFSFSASKQKSSTVNSHYDFLILPKPCSDGSLMQWWTFVTFICQLKNIFAMASGTMFHFGGIDTPEREVKNNIEEYKYIDWC